MENQISKPEVKKLLVYPGMIEKMVSSGVGGILELYTNSGDANKAISTVLTETTYHSILKEKISGNVNGDLERKIELYSDYRVTELCNDAVVVGAEKMVYSLNMLHNALRENKDQTMEILGLIGEMKSAHDIAFAFITILSINDRVKGASKEETLGIAKECVEYMSEFKRLNAKLSTI